MYVVKYSRGNSSIFFFSEGFIMFKRLIVLIALTLSGFTAHAGVVTLADAGVVTLTNFYLTWDIGTTPENGGSATIHYDDGNYTWDKLFQVSVSPWESILHNSGGKINEWLTPMVGSDTTFAGVSLDRIRGNESVFDTSMGTGYTFWDNNPMDGGMNFPEGYAKWDVQISAVPEPQSWILMASGLLALVTIRKKKIGLPMSSIA